MPKNTQIIENLVKSLTRLPTNKYHDVLVQPELVQFLENLINASVMTIPHLLFFGDYGTGKRRLIAEYLHLLYGQEPEIVMQEYSSRENGKLYSYMAPVSIYHLEIDVPRCPAVILHLVVQQYMAAFFVPLPDKKFRTVVLHNSDALSQASQMALRRIIETNNSQFRFVMWTRNISKLMSPIISRFMVIRVPLPTPANLLALTYHILKHENVPTVTVTDVKQIVNKSGRNIRRLLALINIWLTYQKLADARIGDFYSPNKIIHTNGAEVKMQVTLMKIFGVVFHSSGRMIKIPQLGVNLRNLLAIRSDIYALVIALCSDDFIFTHLLQFASLALPICNPTEDRIKQNSKLFELSCIAGQSYSGHRTITYIDHLLVYIMNNVY